MRAAIEIADIFRAAGPAYRAAQAGHLSLHQLKVMAAIEQCRTAALGGHVEACADCEHTRIAYNSCRNRHCPKCQGAAARTWLAAREVDLLPVGYYRRDGPERYGTTTLATHEFIRRFLLHVLPKGFHRIRHYGLLASAGRRANLARIRELLAVPLPVTPPERAQRPDLRPPCPCCGGRMTVVEIFGRFQQPRGPPTAPVPTGIRAT